MQSRAARLTVVAAFLVAPTGLPLHGQPGYSVVRHLEAYQTGDHATVISELEVLAAANNLDRVLEGLQKDARRWIDSAPPAERGRRVMTAATYALEAGKAGAFSEWKWVSVFRQTFGTFVLPGGGFVTPNTPEPCISIVWKPPPQLIEWGCELLRAQPEHAAFARVWHLAALAAAQRAGDFEFLIGSPFEVRHNEKEEIEHLKHSRALFPDESRFMLGQAVAIEWLTYPDTRRTLQTPRARDAIGAYEDLAGDDRVGAEANVRLGSLLHRAGRSADALKALTRADRATRDPFLVYLAAFLTARVHEAAGRFVEAEQSYQRALLAVPRGQSAAIALGTLLVSRDRRAEAARLMDNVMAAPAPIDPWREYGLGDFRFWPQLITQLREAAK